MSSELRIGKLASAAGVSADTVRYYERRKLIPRPSRTAAGYRVYSDQDVERLQFIKRAQTLGLSLDEIKALLPVSRKSLSECRQISDLLSTKLAELDKKIAEMRGFRKTLSMYLKECEAALAGKRGDSCPVLFEITRPVPPLKDSRRRKATISEEQGNTIELLFRIGCCKPLLHPAGNRKRQIGWLFAKPLKLKSTAWDVYLVYAPGIKWEGNQPPEPSLWMHQLNGQGADTMLCLNPMPLSRRVQRFVEAGE